MSPIRLIVVDDHLLFRIGLRSVFAHASDRFTIVAEAGGVEEFRRMLPTVEADVVLLDIILPDGNGLDLSADIRRERPDLRILVLSAETDEDTIARFVETGLDGFVSKAVPVEELFEAIENVNYGLEYYGKDIARLIHYVSVSKKDAPEDIFTPRENEVIKLCSEGLSAKEISDRLNINVATVNTHKNNIFKKLGINSSVDLVRYAVKHGLITI